MPLKTVKATTAPMRTWIRILLFGSLALNLLVVGLVGGVMLSPGWRGPPPHPDRMVRPIIQALSHSDRRAIGLALRKEFRRSQPNRRSVQQDFVPVIDALRAVPFASDAVEKSLMAQMDAQGMRLQLSQKFLVARIREMSVKERSDFTDRLVLGIESAPSRDLRRPQN